VIELAVIATTVVAKFLVPLLVKTADGMRDDLQEQVSEGAAKAVADTAGKLWKKVTGVFSSGDDQKAVELFESQPTMMAPVMEELLRKHLENDSAFRDEIEALLNETTPDGKTVYSIAAENSVVIDARAANLSGSAQIIGMQVGNQPRPSGPPSNSSAEDVD
jgi:hypothetical protein